MSFAQAIEVLQNAPVRTPPPARQIMLMHASEYYEKITKVACEHTVDDVEAALLAFEEQPHEPQ
jgi:hypothetical protein